MTRNLLMLHGYHNTQFQDCAVYMVILLNNFNYCYPPSAWNIFELVIPINLLREKSRNYVSIIVNIVSNITVLMSQNVILFGYFMPIGHGVNKEVPLSVSPSLLASSGFHQFCLYLTNKYFNKLL